jgi:hypothetical protein
MALNGHEGEDVGVYLSADWPVDHGGPPGAPLSKGILEIHGELRRVVDMQAAAGQSEGAAEWSAGLFRVGGLTIHRSYLPGTVTEDRDGVTFTLAEGITLRIASRAGGDYA